MTKRDITNRIAELTKRYDWDDESPTLLDIVGEIFDMFKSLNYGDQEKIAFSLIMQLNDDLMGGIRLKTKSKYVGIQKMNVEYAISRLVPTLIDMAIFKEE